MRGLPNFDPDRLRKLREADGLTQEQLATLVGTEATAVSHWESGRRKPDPTNLRALATALRVDPAQLQTNDPGVATTLRHLREHAGLTQDQVATQLGIRGGAYSKIERGLTRLHSAERVAGLARLLKVSEAEILAAMRNSAAERDDLPEPPR